MNLSIIVPVYNNSDSLVELVQRITKVVNYESNYFFEIIFVDDGSTDKSWSTLIQIKDKYNNSNLSIKIIKLIKNFGQMPATIAGIKNMAGDACVVISADLQDSPETIPEILRKAEKGAKFIIVKRLVRFDSFFTKFISAASYFLITKRIKNFPAKGFDYFFITNDICEKIVNMNGRYRYLQPELVSLGYKVDFVNGVRSARKYGKSGQNFSKKFNYLLTALIDSSPILIRSLTSIGIISIFASLTIGIIAIINRMSGNSPFSGFTTLLCIIIFFSGIQIVLLSIVGEYVWRIFDTSRSKPLYTIEIIS